MGDKDIDLPDLAQQFRSEDYHCLVVLDSTLKSVYMFTSNDEYSKGKMCLPYGRNRYFCTDSGKQQHQLNEILRWYLGFRPDELTRDLLLLGDVGGKGDESVWIWLGVLKKEVNRATKENVSAIQISNDFNSAVFGTGEVKALTSKAIKTLERYLSDLGYSNKVCPECGKSDQWTEEGVCGHCGWRRKIESGVVDKDNNSIEGDSKMNKNKLIGVVILDGNYNYALLSAIKEGPRKGSLDIAGGFYDFESTWSQEEQAYIHIKQEFGLCKDDLAEELVTIEKENTMYPNMDFVLYIGIRRTALELESQIDGVVPLRVVDRHRIFAVPLCNYEAFKEFYVKDGVMMMDTLETVKVFADEKIAKWFNRLVENQYPKKEAINKDTTSSVCLDCELSVVGDTDIGNKLHIAVILQNQSGAPIFSQDAVTSTLCLIEDIVETPVQHPVDKVLDIIEKCTGIGKVYVNKSTVTPIVSMKLSEASEHTTVIYTCKLNNHPWTGRNFFVFRRQEVDTIDGNDMFRDNGKDISKIVSIWKTYVDKKEAANEAIKSGQCPKCGKSELLSTGQCSACGYQAER